MTPPNLLSASEALSYLGSILEGTISLSRLNHYLAYRIIPSVQQRKVGRLLRLVSTEDLDHFAKTHPTGSITDSLLFDTKETLGPEDLSLKDAYEVYSGSDPSPLTYKSFLNCARHGFLRSIRDKGDKRRILGFSFAAIEDFLALREGMNEGIAVKREPEVVGETLAPTAEGKKPSEPESAPEPPSWAKGRVTVSGSEAFKVVSAHHKISRVEFEARLETEIEALPYGQDPRDPYLVSTASLAKWLDSNKSRLPGASPPARQAPAPKRNGPSSQISLSLSKIQGNIPAAIRALNDQGYTVIIEP